MQGRKGTTEVMEIPATASLICMLSTPPPLIAPWHFWVSLLSRQQAASGSNLEKDGAQGGNRQEREKKQKKTRETERDREGDG